MTLYNIAEYEVPMAVVMKSSIFWDIMPHIPFKGSDISEERVAFIFKVEE
jgi:hypothetical protein